MQKTTFKIFESFLTKGIQFHLSCLYFIVKNVVLSLVHTFRLFFLVWYRVLKSSQHVFQVRSSSCLSTLLLKTCGCVNYSIAQTPFEGLTQVTTPYNRPYVPFQNTYSKYSHFLLKLASLILTGVQCKFAANDVQRIRRFYLRLARIVVLSVQRILFVGIPLILISRFSFSKAS